MTNEQKIAALRGIDVEAQEAASSLAALGVSVGVFISKVYEMFWHQYILVGAPYGKTDKGFQQWLREETELR